MSMRNVQVVLGVLFGVAVFLFLDYALPSRETFADAAGAAVSVGFLAICILRRK